MIKKNKKQARKGSVLLCQRNFFYPSVSALFPAKSEQKQSQKDLEEGYDGGTYRYRCII